MSDAGGGDGGGGDSGGGGYDFGGGYDTGGACDSGGGGGWFSSEPTGCEQVIYQSPSYQPGFAVQEVIYNPSPPVEVIEQYVVDEVVPVPVPAFVDTTVVTYGGSSTCVRPAGMIRPVGVMGRPAGVIKRPAVVTANRVVTQTVGVNRVAPPPVVAVGAAGGGQVVTTVRTERQTVQDDGTCGKTCVRIVCAIIGGIVLIVLISGILKCITKSSRPQIVFHHQSMLRPKYYHD